MWTASGLAVYPSLCYVLTRRIMLINVKFIVQIAFSCAETRIEGEDDCDIVWVRFIANALLVSLGRGYLGCMLVRVSATVALTLFLI